ncbi:hypothetical protein FB107DRAFT_252931, partial [Schizophyllum commune]
ALKEAGRTATVRHAAETHDAEHALNASKPSQKATEEFGKHILAEMERNCEADGLNLRADATAHDERVSTIWKECEQVQQQASDVDVEARETMQKLIMNYEWEKQQTSDLELYNSARVAYLEEDVKSLRAQIQDVTGRIAVTQERLADLGSPDVEMYEGDEKAMDTPSQEDDSRDSYGFWTAPRATGSPVIEDPSRSGPDVEEASEEEMDVDVE